MALTLGRGKFAAVQSGHVSVTALFECAVELQVVRNNAGWFEFGSRRLGENREQAIDFLTNHLPVANHLQRGVLKVIQEGGTRRWKTERIRFRKDRSRVEASPGGAKPSSSEEAINNLYDELAGLTAEQMQPPEDVNLQLQVSSKLKHLRQLQEAEADVIQQRFRGSLSVPLGTLQDLLKRKQELSVQDEDPSAADETSDVAD